MLRGWLNLEPPCGEWRKAKAPQLVSLAGGKFCFVELFQDRRGKSYGYPYYREEADERFAVFTGVEVVRHSRDGDDGDDGDEPPKNGRFEDGHFRVIKHKSKTYVLTNYNATIEFVL